MCAMPRGRPKKLAEIPIAGLNPIDTSDRNVERMARGYIVGNQALTRRKEVREQLEKKVVERIGKKGKYLTDKLFELIEGVYVIERMSGKGGRDIKYYQVPPNLEAIKYALDRVLGKPTQQIESKEERKGIMVVETIIRNLAEDGTTKQRGTIIEGSIPKNARNEDIAGNIREGEAGDNAGLGAFAV